MNSFSFEKGWGQVRRKDSKRVKSELMDALKINNRVSWTLRLRGKIEPKVTEVEAVEKVFRANGIKQIWGEE